MTTDDKPAKAPKEKKKADALAAALRANLIRRKAARSPASPAPPPKDDGPERRE
jgi:hypothetical protein